FEGQGELQVFADFVARQLLPWCRTHYRLAPAPAHVFSSRAGIAESLSVAAGRSALLPLPAASDGTPASEATPALVGGLRALLSTAKNYGDNITALQKPWLMSAMVALSPLLKKVYPGPGVPDAENPHRLHSKLMQRDFEVFAVLPASAAAAPGRRYQAL